MSFDTQTWPIWLVAIAVVLTLLKVYVPVFESWMGAKTQKEKIKELEERVIEAERKEAACMEKYLELNQKYMSVFAFANAMENAVSASGAQTLEEFLKRLKDV